MNYGSLFSGIGGFDLGFTRAGMECAWQVEIDKKCQDVLRRNLPGAEIYDDVTKVGKHNLTPVDLVCGGFPCQDLSVAGRRAGLAGERSGLWFEFHRILAELRPGWVVIENVPGLLSSNGGRDFAVLLHGLVELGYGTTWRVLDAQYFGVAQRRRRVFIVGHLGDGRAAQVLFEREGSGWDTAPRREAGQGVARTLDGKSASSNRGSQANETEFVVPQQVQWASGGGQVLNDTAQALRSGAEHNYQFVAGVETAAPRVARQGNGAFTDPVNDNIITVARSTGAGWYTEDDKASIRAEPEGTTFDLIAFTQNTRDEVRQINGDGQIAGALGAEPGMKQQNYIAWHGAQITSPQNMGGVFEDVTPTVNEDPRLMVAWHNKQQSGEVRIQGETVNALTQQWGTGGNNVPFVGVRRLTPVECERLQGFPDNWTDGQADSTRYRQLGNAVAVPCAEWIARRIVYVA